MKNRNKTEQSNKSASIRDWPGNSPFFNEWVSIKVIVHYYKSNEYDTNATWSRTSDIRWKKDVNTNTDCGLSLINDLRTVTYKWKAPSERPSEMAGYNPEVTEPTHKEKMYGFIAQEVKESLDKHNITDFNGWNCHKDGAQGVSYEMFVIPLVKAVQELSAENAELKSLIKNSTSFAKLKSSL